MVPSRFRRVSVGSRRASWVVFSLLFLLLAPCCYSGDIVFIRLPGGSSRAQAQLEVATSFYGLDLKVVTVSSPRDDLAVRMAVGQEETVGVAIAADALVAVDENAVLSVVNRRRKGRAPLFILGMASDADSSHMRAWSAGRASGCGHLQDSLSPQYIFGQARGLTSQLAGLEIPLPNHDVSYILMAENGAARRIMSVRYGIKFYPYSLRFSLTNRRFSSLAPYLKTKA